jgi:hypothetical protein
MIMNIMTYKPQTLIDRITYTASLVTHPSDVDPYLDKMRAITSRTNFLPENMSFEEVTTLSELQRQLEVYLMQEEKLRFFTPDSLQAQIELHMSGGKGAKQSLLKVDGIFITSVIAAVIVSFLPILRANDREHIIFAGAVASALMNVGAAWLFVDTLPAFRAALRQAFQFFCIGMIVFGFGLLLEPYIAIWNLRNKSSLATLIVMPIVVVSVALMYVGIVQYARLAYVKGRLLSPKVVLLLAALLAVVIVILPVLFSHTFSKLATYLSVLLHGWLVVLTVAMIILLTKTIHNVADLYKPPLRALLQAIIFLVIAAVAFMGITAGSGPHLTTTTTLILFALLFVTGGMLLRAGYKFNTISRY